MNYRQAAGSYGIPGNTDSFLAAAATALDVVAARTNYTFYLQRLTYVPTVVAAQAITIRAKTTTTALYALIPASQATPYTFDFGPEGLALTAGEAHEAIPASAGPAGRFRVEGYYKLTSAIAYTAANQ